MLDCKHHIKMKPFVRRLLGAAVSVAVLYSCASVGRLEGGPIDEEPPRFVTGSPLPGALHNKKSKISIEFDEFIKLEKANEKVVISPPQVQQPEIKANGKRVVVNAGAAMVVAALMADGTSEIEEIGHIERGYENIVEKLRGLGADISKVDRVPAALEQAL